MNTEEYHKLAQVEDRHWYFFSLHRHVDRALTQAFPRLENPRILDAGCGTGGLIRSLTARHPSWSWTGIDFSPLACKFASERTGHAFPILQGSISALPFADASFDAVVSTDVVSHVDDPYNAARECFRVLRPGGLVVLNLPAYRWLWSYHDELVQTKHRYSRVETESLLSTAGFRGLQITHWNALPFPLIWAKRKIFCRRNNTSDVGSFPLPVDLAFRGIMLLEHAWINLGGRWLWGSSLFSVARKPLASERHD